MKRKITAMALALSILVSMGAAAETKTEYDNAVDFVTANRIMEGDENGNMRLDEPITRAEFVKMLMTAAGSCNGEDNDVRFDDITDSYWAAAYIQDAARAGFVDGYEDHRFHPDDRITYAQAVKIILAVCGINTTYTQYPFGYISEAMDNGLLEHIDFRPEEAITRRDTAEIMYNAYNSIQSGMMSLKEPVYNRAQAVGYGLFTQKSEALTEYADNTSGFGSGGGAMGASVGINAAAPQAAAEAPMASSSTALAPERAAKAPAGVIFNPSRTGEEYENYEPNSFKKTALSPLSTFSIDTDTASYSNMRRFISVGYMPEDGSVRTEELINYFEYETPEMAEDAPFGVTAQITDCPWSENKLARITIAGAEAETDRPSNLVFLIDISGSMGAYNKLPMLKKAMDMLADGLGEADKVSIVTYASGTAVALEPTACDPAGKKQVKESIDALRAGGGTNGAGGLSLAYSEIEKSFIEGGNNRIILCSDGDFNIGPSSTDELKKLVEEKRSAGIYLTTMGFGMGNYKDNRMELLADYGNGSYYYIDNMREAKRVFADKLNKTLYTVAEDVKLQVEFNPAVVSEYRLAGYENRKLDAEDFEDDTVDAGELGAGAKVTAVYELVMNGDGYEGGDDSTYRYQTTQYKGSDEAFDVKIRYKNPGGEESILKEFPVENKASDADEDTRFAAAAAMLGLKLNGVIEADYREIAELAKSAVQTSDSFDSDMADRWEFIQLTELLQYIVKK